MYLKTKRNPTDVFLHYFIGRNYVLYVTEMEIL